MAYQLYTHGPKEGSDNLARAVFHFDTHEEAMLATQDIMSVVVEYEQLEDKWGGSQGTDFVVEVGPYTKDVEDIFKEVDRKLKEKAAR